MFRQTSILRKVYVIFYVGTLFVHSFFHVNFGQWFHSSLIVYILSKYLLYCKSIFIIVIFNTMLFQILKSVSPCFIINSDPCFSENPIHFKLLPFVMVFTHNYKKKKHDNRKYRILSMEHTVRLFFPHNIWNLHQKYHINSVSSYNHRS